MKSGEKDVIRVVEPCKVMTTTSETLFTIQDEPNVNSSIIADRFLSNFGRSRMEEI